MTTNIPHTINWFEVPVKDISRAMSFYEKVFDIKMQKEEFEGTKMAIFPSANTGETYTVHGALVQGEGYTPSETGALIYFNCGNDLTTALNKVETSGGKVTTPKTKIGEHGYCAFFTDTEGNRLGLHSPN